MASSELGVVLAHEHVVLDFFESHGPDDPNPYHYQLPGIELMAPDLKEAAASGPATVVSVTNAPMGRDIGALRAISEASGVNVVASTGYYTRWASPQIDDASALTDNMVAELTKGIEGTDVRAGVIGEIGSVSAIPSDFEYRLFKAAAEAHHATGAPITTHTHGGQYALWQLNTLTQHGVPSSRVIIGHLDDPVWLLDGKAPDLDLLVRLADRGAYIAFDCVGVTDYGHWVGRPEPTDRDRAWAVTRLVERGYSDHIILSHDVARPQDLKVNGGPGHGHIEQNFLPYLEQFGISPEVSRKFISDNPRRWLTGE
ncbi:phosphotriesterase [Micromonospora sp. NPDC048830]|uniref:phosphotriesterase family protein n=1 Tax=Micromonospora sp. NPDC048830 TaxID=3364257 RepID=UPI00371C0413